MWELESGLILFTNLLDFFIFLIIFFRFKVFIFLLYFPCFIILQYLLSLPFNPNDMPFTVNDINLGATGFFLLFAMAVGDFFTHEGKVINILFNWCSEVFNVFLFNSTVWAYQFIEFAPVCAAGIILFFPLIAALISLIGGGLLGNKLTSYFSTFMTFVSCVVAALYWLFFQKFAIAVNNFFLSLHTDLYKESFEGLAWVKKNAEKLSYEEAVYVKELFTERIRLCGYYLEHVKTNKFLNGLFNNLDPFVSLDFGEFINFFGLNASWSLRFDNLSVSVAFVILLISFCVQLFSCDYMRNDPHSARFFSFLSFFTFFMLLLVVSYNLLVFYIAWEGVGMCSFLLISFWFTRSQALKAALKALLVNKIGDVAFLIATSMIYSLTRSLEFDNIFFSLPITGLEQHSFFTNYTQLDVICFFLLLAALVKSAQLFFHIWLADAMEGPTPVSALLHAATMVVAGVFLIIRFSYLFEFAPSILNLMVYISVATIILIGFIGLFQNDLKKIIAYSTCSQLGFMFLACGLSGYSFALFHLFNHAFFKALLFLSAGNIIHALRNEQDIRKMGGLKKVLPFSYMTFLISSLSLVGFPFFSGYYSKDSIIGLAYVKFVINGGGLTSYILYILILFSLFLTCAYSFKIIFYIFLKDSTNISPFLKNKVSSHFNFFNSFPLFLLTLLSLFGGAYFKDYFIGVGSSYFYESSILCLNDNVNYYIFFKEVKVHILFILITSYVSSVIFCHYAKNDFSKLTFHNNKYFRKIFIFFNRKAHFDEIYHMFINSYLYKLGYKVYLLIDKGLLEIFGPKGLSKVILKLSEFTKKVFNAGPIQFLVYLMLIGVIVLLLVWLIFL